MNHSGSTPVFVILYSSLRVIAVLVFLFSSCSFSCYYFVLRIHCGLRAFAVTTSMAEEAPDPKTLAKYFGPYSPTAKGIRTLRSPNTLFSGFAYFLSEVTFVAPNPHIMHRSWARFIIAT